MIDFAKYEDTIIRLSYELVPENTSLTGYPRLRARMIREDIQQEMRIAIFLLDEGHTDAYIRSRARSRAINYLRQELRYEIIDEQAETQEYESETYHDNYEELYDAIGKLTQKQKIVVWRKLEGYDEETIAILEGVSRNAIHQRWIQARNTLRRLLGEESKN